MVAALIVRPWRLKRLWLRLLIASPFCCCGRCRGCCRRCISRRYKACICCGCCCLDVGLLLALCMVVGGERVAGVQASRARGCAPVAALGLLPELHPHMLDEARLGLASNSSTHSTTLATPRPASSGRRACANTGLMRTTRAGGSVLAFSAPSLSGTTVALMPPARHRRRPR